MKNRYQTLNNLLGWLVFVIASAVYLLTAEPTTSWWDCGEYISTAYKLEVGHPPGAPTFQLIGRFASLFAGGDVMKVAYAINAMSAICSGLSILFLFWSITMLGRKLVLKSSKEIDTFKTLCIFGSGLIGALAYTFSDTFWFSAVEGEVYAMSSFFTAIVFWAILKWETQADEKHSLRWLILLAFLIGIAIGVHLLNLLAIPAMVFVFYFKKYKTITKKGIFYALLLSVALLIGVLYIIVPYISILAGNFEIFFVNSIGMPFNSGIIIFFALLIAGIVFGLIWTNKKAKPVLNAVILSFAFLLVGYSSFLILIIRSNANTPLNENEPKDAVAFRAYLGREQYGEVPLFTGPYYTARAYKWNYGYQKYIKGENDYIPVARYRTLEYESEQSTVFPRMHNSNGEARHINYYKYWTGIKGDRTPTFGENLSFFFKYQINFMYWRYFMWNFAGRQNDIQGHRFNENGTRDYLHGNWITGIKFWDEMRLGPQDHLPVELRDNKARNTFYCLPLLLGLIGLFYHVKKSKQDAFIVFLLFFMTGLAIIIYVNQRPLEPRERDYAYAGSFYAFAIWIGLGVMALCDWISKKAPKMLTVSAVTLVCLLLVPCIMAKEGWDDHDRSKRYAARDFSKNHLTTCDKNSILFTHGDNDTFPLWFMQEVEGYRTDVRILNYTLAGMHWYIEQLYDAVNEAKPLPLTLPKSMYGVANDFFAVKRYDKYLELKEVLATMASNSSAFRERWDDETEVYVLPTNRLKITLDIPKLVAKGIIPKEIAETIPNEISWEIQKGRLERNELMFLDLLATNEFERAMYIASPNYMKDIFPPISEMLEQEGLNYKIIPYKAFQKVNLDKTYALFAGKETEWGNVNHPTVYLENAYTMHISSITRQIYSIFAQNLVQAGRNQEALTILDKSLHFFPASKIPLDVYCVASAETYNQLGNTKKAESMMKEIANYYQEKIRYFNMFRGSKAKGVAADLEDCLGALSYVYDHAKRMNLESVQKQIEAFMGGNVS